MTAIASGIIVAWPSTAASIPAGWTRETSLDAKYIRGADVLGNADLTSVFGSDTHTHTSPAHTPIQNPHGADHIISDGGNDGSSLNVGTGKPSVQFAPLAHLHTDATANNTTATNNSVTITVDATSNDLSFKRVIFIKSNGAPTKIPNLAYAFFESDTLPTGWSRVLGNTYLKGAVAGGDGGATGGSNSHAHTSPAHTHTQNAHTHTATSGGVDIIIGRKSAAGSSLARGTHTHALTGDAAIATNQPVTTTINSTAAEPVHKKLNCISNGNAAGDLPNNVIALWGGTHSGIPANWARYTSMDTYFHKGANADGESNVTTGGSAQHNHTASDCQPTQDVHFHNWSGGSASTTGNASGAGVDISAAGHTHTWVEGGSGAIATNNAAAVTINNCSSEAAYPKHAKVIFVQFTTPPVTTGFPVRGGKWKPQTRINPKKTFMVVKEKNQVFARPVDMRPVALDIMKRVEKKRREDEDEEDILLLLQHLGDI